MEKYGIEVTAINTSGGPPNEYTFYEGPLTIGVVPPKYRQQRIDNYKRASDFAKRLGVPALHSHFGFIPENPNDPDYEGVVGALRDVATHVKGNGQIVLMETGQETPITMLRAITDAGVDNQFVNLDCANLILYGKGNPLDALDVVGHLVRGTHAKDGLFPTNPQETRRGGAHREGESEFPQTDSAPEGIGIHRAAYHRAGNFRPPAARRHQDGKSLPGKPGRQAGVNTGGKACYSTRNASMGEMEAARLAGMMAAKKAQRESALAARMSANGSQLETP